MKKIILSTLSATALLATGITASISSANACGYRYYEPCQVAETAEAAPAKVAKPKKKAKRKAAKRKTVKRKATKRKVAKKVSKKRTVKKAPKPKMKHRTRTRTAATAAPRHGCCARRAPAPKPVAAPSPRRGCCVTRTVQRAAPVRCRVVTRVARRSCR